MKHFLQIKKYFLEVYSLLSQNKPLYIYPFILSLVTYISVIPLPFDPNELIPLLGGVLIYFLVAYAFLFPLLLHNASNGEKYNLLQITKFISRHTKIITKFILVLLVVFSLVTLAIYLLFDNLLQIKIVEQAFIDSSTQHGFIFNPFGAVYWVIFTITSAPLYFLSMIYFFERNNILFAFKKALLLTRKHLSFIAPFVLIESLYTGIFYLFIPDGNYYFIPIRSLFDSLSFVLIATAIYILYKEHYDTSLKGTVITVERKKPKHKIIRWISIIFALLFAEIGMLLFFIYGYMLIDSEMIRSIIIFVYIPIAISILFLPSILGLVNRSGKIIAFTVLLSIFISIVSFILVASLPQDEQQAQNTGDKTELSSKALLTAINKKREENHVQQLEYEESTCALAKIVVNDVVEKGTDSFYSVAAFKRQVDRISKENPSIDMKQAPDWYNEYLTYEESVEDSISMWESGETRNLFTNEEYQYACVAVKDGFAVVSVSFYETESKLKEDINTPLDYESDATLL